MQSLDSVVIFVPDKGNKLLLLVKASVTALNPSDPFCKFNSFSVDACGPACWNGIQLTFFSHSLFNLFQDNNYNPFDFLPSGILAQVH